MANRDVVERTLLATNLSLAQLTLLAYGGLLEEALIAKRKYLNQLEIIPTLQSYCLHRL